MGKIIIDLGKIFNAYPFRSSIIFYACRKHSGSDMSRKRNTFWVRFLTSHQHLSVNDMLRRSIHQPVASLHEKDVNNLRCNRRLDPPSALQLQRCWTLTVNTFNQFLSRPFVSVSCIPLRRAVVLCPDFKMIQQLTVYDIAIKI